jgi:hypothetical protein
MVEIHQTSDLFKPGIMILSWNFEGEKKIRNEYEIRIDQYEKAFTRIKLKALVIFVQELFRGRKHNFEYYNRYVIADKLEAISALERDIPALSDYTDVVMLANRIKNRIIPNLEQLRPGKESKIVSYGPKLDLLSMFVNRILITNKLNEQKSTITPTITT